jgi:hypothetical protein
VVDTGHDFLGRPIARREGGAHLRQPLGPVIDVIGKRRRRVGYQRAMAGQQDPYRRVVGQRLHGVQRAQVIGERPVAADDGGAAAEHGVPGEQGAVLREQQAEGVRGMARRTDDAQLAAGRRHHIAAGQAVGAQSVRRIGRAHRRPGESGKPPRACRMIAVPVRQQDLRHPAAGLRDPVHDTAQVTLILGAGIDDDRGRGSRRGDHPGVRALQGHGRRIGREDTGR